MALGDTIYVFDIELANSDSVVYRVIELAHSPSSVRNTRSAC